ncbi:alpha/beta hydrolase [Streptomyces sp. NPDC006678]|uniref:alpha/beta fold hydrolase n=1 Tax=Streptomyces sp. NPDC006678 TaxID=3157185 RepID=UPI0033CDEF2C
MVEHRTVTVGGRRLHIAQEGEGPLVLLLHGFPECWYNWRHQFTPLAGAGYHVVAVDQRGYARSDRPAAVEEYTILHLVGDVIGLIRELGAQQAVVIGHDLGGMVGWSTALMRPDVVRGIVGLSVPPPQRGPVPPLQAMRELFGGQFYWNYFQTPGVADAELAQDLNATFRRVMYGLSGDNPHSDPPVEPLVPPGKGFLELFEDPEELPAWLTEADIDTLAAEFTEAGFTSALNWYRNFDCNWQLTAPWEGAQYRMPGRYITGDRDLVYGFPGMDQLLPALPTLHPTVGPARILPGCGHWIAEERPGEVNAALLEFLGALNT